MLRVICSKDAKKTFKKRILEEKKMRKECRGKIFENRMLKKCLSNGC